jgi:hypothetical protein
MIGDGDQIAIVQNVIPDEKHLGELSISFHSSDSPTGVERLYGPYALTDPTPVRFAAREVRFRFEQVIETSWRLGIMQVGILPGGKR